MGIAWECYTRAMGRKRRFNDSIYTVCCLCKMKKPVADFSRDGQRADRLALRCRSCDMGRKGYKEEVILDV